MVANYNERIHAINSALVSQAQIAKNLSDSGDGKSVLAGAIAVAESLIGLLGCDETLHPEDVIDSGVLSFPNAERQDTWFHQHPWMRGERAAFTLLDSDILPIQVKLYWLQKKAMSHIAGGVHFTKNWEDFDFTRTDEFKIGIDFFLKPDGSGLLVVLANRGKLRVVEVSERLTNTQVEIFENWFQAASIQNRHDLHAALWDSFKLQSVNAKFYEGVAGAFNELVFCLTEQGRPAEEAKLFSSRLLGRIIFVWFIRKMSLISGEIDYFNAADRDQSDYYRAELEYLFFDVLNVPVASRSTNSRGDIDLKTPYLNGGLFARNSDDWVADPNLIFPDAYFVRLYSHLDDFNFTTDESTPDYEQVAIDPEMLGRVFESLLASQNDDTGEQARKARGAFYTPREIVSSMCREAVRSYLSAFKPNDARYEVAIAKLIDTSEHEWAIAGTNSLRDIPKEFQAQILTSLRTITTLDPACGSGAFPMGMLQLLTKLRSRLEPTAEIHTLKLSILKQNIFGSDIEPMAVEISRIRSWLSLIIEELDGASVEPLPNLEFNFVVANSLITLEDDHLLVNPDLHDNLSRLRNDFFSATAQKRAKIQKQFQKLIEPDLFDEYDNRGRQLKSFNPFDTRQAAEFFDSEFMFGISDGFDVVMGNPPYVDSEYMAKRTPEFRQYLKDRYVSTAGNWDLYVPFIEHGINVAKTGGVVTMIVKNSLLGARYSVAIRKLMASHGLESLVDYGNVRVFESASVDTCIFRLTKNGSGTLVDVASMESMEHAGTRYHLEISKVRNEANWYPFFYDDPVRDLLDKLNSYSSLNGSGVVSNAAAIVSEAYLLSPEVVENAEPGADEFKLINTGSVDPYVNYWGSKPVKYLGSVYDHPTVSLASLLKINPTRAKQAQSPKIIVIGMGNVEAYLDEFGEYCAGKSTNIVYFKDANADTDMLIYILALLNSPVARFWFRTNFLAAGMGGLSPDNLLSLPVPKLDKSTRNLIVNLVRQYLSSQSEGDLAVLNFEVCSLYGLTKEHLGVLTGFIK